MASDGEGIPLLRPRVIKSAGDPRLIENRLHYVRDVTLGEDANRTRSGSGLQVLAALRNLAVTRLRLSGVTNIAGALRRNAARVRDLLVNLCILKN
jgi:hypothetical protein